MDLNNRSEYMRKFALIAISMIIMSVISGCSGKVDLDMQFRTPKDDADIAILKTNYGEMTFQFFPEEAPKAVENFVTHSKNGYYNGLTFHRIIENFMIQGGDPEGNGTGGDSIWGKEFKVEISKSLYHFKGALCMARGNSLTSQGSQFYIVQGLTADTFKAYGESIYQYNDVDYDAKIKSLYLEHGGYPPLDGEYTVFGQMLSGFDVLDKIAAVEVKNDGYGNITTPVEPVIIESIEIVKYKDIK